MNIFFSGIGGSGMSALACFASAKGHSVSGSDRAFDLNPSHPALKPLINRGITIRPQDGNWPDPTSDLVVASTAVEDDRPEILRAKSLGVEILKRPEYLAGIVRGHETIAVAGTSGKSTASGLLAYLMEGLGMSPNFLGGGRVRQFRAGDNPGNMLAGSSGLLVIEACESDGSIVNYFPEHSIILNLSLDHHPIEKSRSMFESLKGNTAGTTIANADDPNLSGLGSAYFSIDSPSDFKAERILLKPLGAEFEFQGVRFALNIPGRHNVYNALSALAMLSVLGADMRSAVPVLAGFTGIERRFEVHLNSGGKLVIDDYAHNPHKIEALISAVRPLCESVRYVFQPHGFGPARLMKDGYIRAFSGGLRDTDGLVVLPIYYAGGTASKDISSEDLAEGVRKKGRNAEAVSREELLNGANDYDCCVVMGARDETLSDLADDIARRLAQ